MGKYAVGKAKIPAQKLTVAARLYGKDILQCRILA
jgi:hypothetical protein